MQFQYKLFATALLLAAATTSQAQIYKIALSGANENPPVTSNGTGTAVVTINSSTHELRVKSVFSGLNGNTTASHIHCCVASPTANAGVVTATPSFVGFPLGVQSGSFDATYNTTLAPTWNAAFVTANAGSTAGAETSFINGVASGGAYLNIHTTTSPGGEIRGTVQRYSFAQLPTLTNFTNVGFALDSLGAGTGALNERLVSMALLGDAPQAAAQQALLPMSGIVVASLASEALFNGHDSIANHLGGLRSEKSTSGAWGRVASHDGELELMTRNSTVDSDGWDVIVGMDTRHSANLLWGGAFSYSSDDYSLNRTMTGTSGSVTAWRATAYAEYKIESAYVDAMISYAKHSTDLARNTGVAALANSSADADQWGARLSAGWTLPLVQDVTLTPQLRLDWSVLGIDGYTETGSDTLALRVNEQTLATARLSVGAQADWSMSSTVKPFIRAFLGHNSRTAAVTTSANFVSGGSAFRVEDAAPDNSGYQLALGANIFSDNNLSGTISYEYGKTDDYESNLFQAKLLWRF